MSVPSASSTPASTAPNITTREEDMPEYQLLSPMTSEKQKQDKEVKNQKEEATGDKRAAEKSPREKRSRRREGKSEEELETIPYRAHETEAAVDTDGEKHEIREKSKRTGNKKSKLTLPKLKEDKEQTREHHRKARSSDGKYSPRANREATKDTKTNLQFKSQDDHHLTSSPSAGPEDTSSVLRNRGVPMQHMAPPPALAIPSTTTTSTDTSDTPSKIIKSPDASKSKKAKLGSAKPIILGKLRVSLRGIYIPVSHKASITLEFGSSTPQSTGVFAVQPEAETSLTGKVRPNLFRFSKEFRWTLSLM